MLYFISILLSVAAVVVFLLLLLHVSVCIHFTLFNCYIFYCFNKTMFSILQYIGSTVQNILTVLPAELRN